MDSFFFNITDTSYKITKIYENKNEHITRVDISNGIVFFDMHLNPASTKEFKVKNLDRMVVIAVCKKGSFTLEDNIAKKTYGVKEDSINVFTSSRQDLTLKIQEGKKTDFFVLFIADFILKRYLSSNSKEVIDFLYNNIQEEVSCELINSQPLDAISLHIIEKIINSSSDDYMNSIRCEHNILEFMIHRFGLLDMQDDELSNDEICIARSSKAILLRSFSTPPSIEVLAHLCATNESKLKKVFKKVHKTTIYGYVQKLRLEKANILLKEQFLNIGEIAKEVGYKHQGHFSKLFYEFYGVYPKDLLKK
ncbi:helix-turn-helix transcriptional regulator [Sulfurimonas sp.]|uniref:helix-turn-helix domain-containing protein n=1 Tax=Sulfurimonas sp. TaxID=2022749 RepID=UPI002AB160FF|nr:helix-turn-helix transcriptional regulator [Sulfurimonas sp.]